MNTLITSDEKLNKEIQKLKDFVENSPVLRKNLNIKDLKKYSFSEYLEEVDWNNTTEMLNALADIDLLGSHLKKMTALKFLNKYDEKTNEKIMGQLSEQARQLRLAYFAKRGIYKSFSDDEIEEELNGFKLITWSLENKLISLEEDDDYQIPFYLNLERFPFNKIYLSRKILIIHLDIVFNIPFTTKANNPNRGDITIRDIFNGVLQNDEKSKKLMYYNMGNILKGLGVFPIRNDIMVPFYDGKLNIERYESISNEGELFFHFNSLIFNNQEINKYFQYLEYKEEDFNKEAVGFKNGIFNPITNEKFNNVQILKNYPKYDFHEKIELNDKQEWAIANITSDGLINLSIMYYNVIVHRRDLKVCFILQGCNRNLGKSTLGSECFENIVERINIKQHYSVSKYTEVLDSEIICFDNLNNFKESIIEFIISSTSGVSDIKRVPYKLPVSISACNTFVPVITTNKEYAHIEEGHQKIIGGTMLDADLKRLAFINFIKDEEYDDATNNRIMEYGASITEEDYFYLMLYLIKEYGEENLILIDKQKEESISNNSLDFNRTLNKIMYLIPDFKNLKRNVQDLKTIGKEHNGVTIDGLMGVLKLLNYGVKPSEAKKVLDADGFKILKGKSTKYREDEIFWGKRMNLFDCVEDQYGVPHFFVNRKQKWGFVGVRIANNIQVLDGILNPDKNVLEEIDKSTVFLIEELFKKTENNNISVYGNNIIIQNEGIHPNKELSHIKVYIINGLIRTDQRTKKVPKLTTTKK